MGRQKRRSAQREIELKFRCDQKVMAGLLDAPVISRNQCAKWRKKIVKTTYYDTPAREFAAQELALRLREEGGEVLQSIKGKGSNTSTLLDRFEVETKLDDISQFPTLLETSFSRGIDKQITRLRRKIRPYLRSDITRTVCEVAYGKALIEIALDRGRVVVWPKGKAPQGVPLCELELELKSGKRADFYRFAAALCADFPLLPSRVSKEQSGLMVLFGGATRRVRLPLPVFSYGTPENKVFQGGLSHGLGLILLNLEPLAVGDGRALKKIRQGLRRLVVLQTAMADSAVVNNISSIKQSLKKLGLARDWQVFMERTLPRFLLMPGLENRQKKALVEITRVAAGHHHRLMGRAREIVQGQEMVSQFIYLQGQAETGLRKGRKLKKLARKRARKCFDRGFKRVVKQVARLKPGNPKSFHRLRRAVRGLRHTMQLFNGILARDKKQAKREAACLAALTGMQEILGQYQDLTRSLVLLKTIEGDLSVKQQVQSGEMRGFITGVLSAEMMAMEKEISRKAKALTDTPV
jgi:inorganic triphosphatase YgiF